MNGTFPTSKRAKISKETPESFLKDDPLLKTMTFSVEDPGVVIQYCADAVIHAGLIPPALPHHRNTQQALPCQFFLQFPLPSLLSLFTSVCGQHFAFAIFVVSSLLNFASFFPTEC